MDRINYNLIDKLLTFKFINLSYLLNFVLFLLKFSFSKNLLKYSSHLFILLLTFLFLKKITKINLLAINIFVHNSKFSLNILSLNFKIT